MFDRFWKVAFAVCGLGAVGAFVFWSLYNKWLSLPIFERLSQDQTFVIMILFLMLTFAALLYIGFLYLRKQKPHASEINDHAFQLHKAWDGVNEINCENLIGPDVSSAARAMAITASSWLGGLVEKKIIIQNHFDDFELLYQELQNCDKLVPGFERRSQKCTDFVSAEMTKAYKEMAAFKKHN